MRLKLFSLESKITKASKYLFDHINKKTLTTDGNSLSPYIIYAVNCETQQVINIVDGLIPLGVIPASPFYVDRTINLCTKIVPLFTNLTEIDERFEKVIGRVPTKYLTFIDDYSILRIVKIP